MLRKTCSDFSEGILPGPFEWSEWSPNPKPIIWELLPISVHHRLILIFHQLEIGQLFIQHQISGDKSDPAFSWKGHGSSEGTHERCGDNSSLSLNICNDLCVYKCIIYIYIIINYILYIRICIPSSKSLSEGQTVLKTCCQSTNPIRSGCRSWDHETKRCEKSQYFGSQFSKPNLEATNEGRRKPWRSQNT